MNAKTIRGSEGLIRKDTTTARQSKHKTGQAEVNRKQSQKNTIMSEATTALSERQDSSDERMDRFDQTIAVQNQDVAKLAAAIVADSALEQKQTQFQTRWGAKMIPEVLVKGGELIYHAKLAQGVEALREGFGMQPWHDAGRRILQANLEAYPSHLSEPVVVQARVFNA